MQNFLDNVREYIDLLSPAELREALADLSTGELLDVWDQLTEEEAGKVFLQLESDKKVALINELSVDQQEELIKSLSIENQRILFEQLEPDDLVDIIQQVSSEARDAVWSSLSDEARKETQFLLRFDEDDAAGIMTPRYLAVRADLTVGQAMHFVRGHARDIEAIYYIYALDQVKRVQGVVSLKDLLFNPDSTRLSEIMEREVVSVREDLDQEEVARTLESHDLAAIPVVDRHNRLLGIITFDDVIDVIREEQTEDLYKMSAMEGGADRYVGTSVGKLIRKRIPWLIILLLAGTITTNVLSLFEPILAAATFLVWFVPVITQTGGNSGTQSSTLMIRGIATGEIHFRDIWKVLGKELAVGIVMGLILGVVIVGRSMFLPPHIGVLQAAAVGASLVFVVLFSSIIGAFAPLIIHKLGFDPTVMAGPLMATVIDVLGLTIYFQIARLILNI